MTREARHIIDKKVGRKPTEFLVSWSWKDVTLFNLEGTRREIEGDIAQLGERLPCKQEVAGSIPTTAVNIDIVAGQHLRKPDVQAALADGQRYLVGLEIDRSCLCLLYTSPI